MLSPDIPPYAQVYGLKVAGKVLQCDKNVLIAELCSVIEYLCYEFCKDERRIPAYVAAKYFLEEDNEPEHS